MIQKAAATLNLIVIGIEPVFAIWRILFRPLYDGPNEK
jgi:hypothetical protein